MILSDRDIRALGTKIIEPFDDKCVQPSSYDLSLDNKILLPRDARIDLRVSDPKKSMTLHEFKDEYYLMPGACILASTKEIISCPNDLSARIEGKSTLGRIFMAVHITAGVIDAGWEGQITLEIVNHGPWEIVLWDGMKIAQLSYFRMTTECDVPYGSKKLGNHYRGQLGPTAAAGKRGRE